MGRQGSAPSPWSAAGPTIPRRRRRGPARRRRAASRRETLVGRREMRDDDGEERRRGVQDRREPAADPGLPEHDERERHHVVEDPHPDEGRPDPAVRRGARAPSGGAPGWRMMAASPTRRATMVSGGSAATAIPVKKNDPPQRSDSRIRSAHSAAFIGRCRGGGPSRPCAGAPTGAATRNLPARAGAPGRLLAPLQAPLPIRSLRPGTAAGMEAPNPGRPPRARPTTEARMARDVSDTTPVGARRELVGWIAEGEKPRPMADRHGAREGALPRGDSPRPLRGRRGIRALLEGMRTIGWQPIWRAITHRPLRRQGRRRHLPGARRAVRAVRRAPPHPARTARETRATSPRRRRSAARSGSVSGARHEPALDPGRDAGDAEGALPDHANYMPKVGTRGLDMMFRTATVQVNLDYARKPTW